VVTLYDALVIGGGPIGSHVACKLAEAGYKVIVLEKKEKLGEPVCCTGIISQNCFDTFNIDSDLVIKKANSAKVFSPTGRIIHLYRKENQACVIDRGGFNIYMAGRAKTAGAEYVFNRTVVDIEQGTDRIIAKTSENSKTWEYQARVVIIAAGFGSSFVKNLGLGEYRDRVIGAQVEVENTSINEIEVYLGNDIAPGFFAWLVPTSPQKALVGLLSRYNAEEYLIKLLSKLEVQGKIINKGNKIKCRGITLKPPSRTYEKRLILVGDAAGQVKPTTGGGIYFGLLGAEIAISSLIPALEKNNFSVKRLSGYQKEWKKKIGNELKNCYWARGIYERLNDEQIDKIFDITIENGIHKALLEAEDLSFDWYSKAILRFIRQKAIANPLRAMRIPLKFIADRDIHAK
jgi:geranylgeranyl reductase family protein